MLEGALLLGRNSTAEDRRPGPFDARRIGDYELLEEIARGGMGVVYRARQASLGRMVAVKLILIGQFADETAVKRFKAEASAAASLRHPGIVTIHEIGEDSGRHFFSMDYVEGNDLGAFMREQPISIRRAAQLLKTISEAVHYAHEHGIVHRDLKPSNVLIDSSSEPRITDFGLARNLKSDDDLTLTGQVLGSPHYISPEQAAGNGAVGVASDLYSLGAILYHLLAARPPFAAETLTGTLHQVGAADPISPRLLNPNVPRDLETICLKCLEKDPARRYPTAKALADELGRFLTDEPIHARAIGPPGKAWRWCRRRPVVAALAAAFGFSLLLGFSGIFWQWHRAERNLYFSTMRRVQDEIEQENIGQARTLLEKYVPKLWNRDFRGWEWYYAWNRCQSDELFSLSPYASGLYAVAISSDASLLASGGQGPITLWDLAKRRKLHELDLGKTVYSLALSKDEKQIIAGTTDGRIVVWELATYETNTVLTNLSWVRSLALAPDGKLLATYAHKGLTLWKVGNYDRLAHFPKTSGTDNLPGGMAFSFDSGLLAYSREGGEIILWDIAKASEVAAFRGHEQNVTALAFSTDGATLISGSRDRTVRVWEIESGRVAKTLHGFSAFVAGLALSPDGRTLAVVGAGNSVRLFESETWHEVRTLVGHMDGCRTAIYSPDGKMIITASKDGSVKFWPASGGGGGSKSQRLPADVSKLQLLQGGDGFYLEYTDQGYAFAAVAAAPKTARVPFPSTDPGGIAMSPDGKIWGIASTNRLKLFVHPSHVLLWDLELPPATGRGLVFSSDGRLLAIHGDDNICRVWSIRASRSADRPIASSHVGDFELKSNSLRNLKFSADNQLLGIAYFKPETAEAWNLRTRSKTELTIEGGISTDIAISRGGSLAVTTCGGGALAVWDLRKGQRVAALGGQLGTLWSVEFSPDETRIAACGGDGTLRIWDRQTLEEVAALELHDERLRQLAFSGNGETLFVVGEDSFGGRRLFTLKAPKNSRF